MAECRWPINPRAALWLVAAVWLMGVLAALGALLRHDLVAGRMATAVPGWPAGSTLKLAADADTLVVFLHPKCPCSRATVSNLARLMGQSGNRLHVTIAFVQPPGVTADWTQTDLRRSAAALPGVSVSVDDAGREALRFGATTSGDAMLFNPSGKLLFHGGLTASRGHEGACIGTDAITDRLTQPELATLHTPTFGCDLLGTSCNQSGVYSHHVLGVSQTVTDASR